MPTAVASVPEGAGVTAPECGHSSVARFRRLDGESRAWLERLNASQPIRDWAIAELHDRLRREAAFHIRRRVRGSTGFPNSDIEDLATQAAGDALLVLLRKLDDFRGESQFWTWARRFAQLEAPVSIRRRLGHEPAGIAEDPEQMEMVVDRGCSLEDLVEIRELLHQVSDGILRQLTTRQRTVLVAVAINGIPTEQLAAELLVTPGAIYKMLHDARASLKRHVSQLHAESRGSSRGSFTRTPAPAGPTGLRAEPEAS